MKEVGRWAEAKGKEREGKGGGRQRVGGRGREREGAGYGTRNTSALRELRTLFIGKDRDPHLETL